MTGLAGATETHERDGKHPSRIGVRDMLSYQSLMLAGAGTRRYEKPELWLGTANWHCGFRHAPPRPQRGTSPPSAPTNCYKNHPSLGKELLHSSEEQYYSAGGTARNAQETR